MKTVFRETFTHGSISLCRDNYGYYVSVVYHRYIKKHKLVVAQSFSAYYGSSALEFALYDYVYKREYMGRLVSTTK